MCSNLNIRCRTSCITPCFIGTDLLCSYSKLSHEPNNGLNTSLILEDLKKNNSGSFSIYCFTIDVVKKLAENYESGKDGFRILN